MKINLNKEIFPRLKFYLKECQKFKKEYPENFNMWELTRAFLDWRHSLNSESSPLSDGMPWLTFSAAKFLEQVVTRDMRIYEYGSGGSTIFFCGKAKEVISIEHDLEWKCHVEEALKICKYTNYKISLVEPKSSSNIYQNRIEDPDLYLSDDRRYNGQSFKDYAADIDKYPDDYFDIVLIDGRARPSCFKHSVSKIKKNGFIILDNAERSHYSYIHKVLNSKNWKKNSYYGPGSCSYHFWETCIWTRT
jgi:hypothetical protein